MEITGDGFKITREPKSEMKTFRLNGVEYPLMITGHSMILDGVSKEQFVKRIKYQRQVEEIKKQWKRN